VGDFYRTYYRPNNARVLVVGDITLPEARAMLARRFGAWERGAVPALLSPRPPASAPSTFYLVDKPGAAQSVIRIGHVGVTRGTPDFYALRVMNTILGGSFTSRLNQNLRETHGYTYGANSGYAMRRLAGPFAASASVVTAKTDSSLIEFLKELRRMRDSIVPAEELAKARAYIALGVPGDFETAAGTGNQFMDLLQNDLPLNTLQSFIARINAVSAADVQRAARRYIDPDHFAIVVVGDRAQIESGIRALGEGPISVRDLWGQEIH
jgi:predicted Zn-dependent peptidase